MILGVDIGAAGALAFITPDGDLIEVAEMPILRDGPKNRATARVKDDGRAEAALIAIAGLASAVRRVPS